MSYVPKGITGYDDDDDDDEVKHLIDWCDGYLNKRLAECCFASRQGDYFMS